MQKNIIIFLALSLTFLFSGCFRQDIRTFTVKVPQMKTIDCGKRIQDSLSRIDGILSTEPRIEERTIDVTYDSKKLAIKNIEFLIAGVGFDANDITATPEARASLPPECK